MRPRNRNSFDIMADVRELETQLTSMDDEDDAGYAAWLDSYNALRTEASDRLYRMFGLACHAPDDGL